MASDEDLKQVIRVFYTCAALENTEKVIALCTEDVVLRWGNYTFEGTAAIERWVRELAQSFSGVAFIEKSLSIHRGEGLHEFLLRINTPIGGEGLIPVAAKYLFRDGKILALDLSLQEGLIVEG